GTTEFHGSAYYSKQAPVLFANQWFANANRQPKTDFNYDRYGGSFGGPVILPGLYDGKNRTFFMYGPEGFKDSRPRNNGTPTTLTDANKRGDFSAQLAGGGANYTIYDPLTRRETAPGVYTATAFPGNIIPENRIHPISRALLQYWPSPTSQGDAVGRQNFQNPNLLEVTDYFNHTLRLDHSLSDSQRLAFRWSSYDRDSNYNNYFGNLATGENFQFISRATSLDYIKVLDAQTVLNLRYGYNRFIRVTANNPESDGFDLTSLGFSPTYVNQISADNWKFPRIDISGYQGTGIGGEYRPNDTHAFIGTVNRTVGSHAVKFGTEFRSYRENAVFDGNDTVGQFVFDATYTRPASNAANSPDQIAQSAAAFLLGLPTTSRVVRASSYAEQSTSWGFFVHDDWRVSDRLTLNLGVRWEFETPLEERFGRSLAAFDPNANVTVNGRQFRGAYTVGEPGKGLFNTPKDLIMPRFGFAYRLGDKTVLRGGYGIYYGFLGQRRTDVQRAGFSRNTEYNASPDGGLNFTRNIGTVFQEPLQEPPSASEIPATLVGTGNTFFNPNPKTPQNQRWQFGFQRELPGAWVAEASYVGNRGTRHEITRDINPLPKEYLSTSRERDQANITFLNANIPNPYAGQLLITGGLNNATYGRAQSLRPFPYYGDLNTTTNQGYSWYHSLQANIQKRFSSGYTVLGSYTWSKFMEALTYMNPGDPMPLEMISPFDRPHRLSVSAVYELPFGRGKALLSSENPVLSRIVGGWQLNGIYTYQSGAPLSWGGNFAFNGSFEDIALDSPTRERWINTDAGFNRNSAQALDRHIRTFPQYISATRSHRLSNVDFSIIKNTDITERINVQFRGEALNAFNSPHFAGPELNPTSANFGVVNNVQNYARRIQLGARLVF
ncbi:MAG TPA: TonB-dependent receptor, partial [Bryobacteraceae bacterium]|nr:TonB-dependent receptor [Bryobacteraceae bacterium]